VSEQSRDGYRLNWTTEYRDLRDVFAWNLFRRWRFMRFLRIVLFVIVALWITTTVLAQRISPTGVVEIVAIIVLVIFAPDLATWALWRSNGARLRRGSVGEITESGLAISNGGMESRLDWSEIGRLEQTRRVWLFRMATSKNLVMVPKRAVPGPEEEFAAYVRGHLGAGDNR
jgi:hypothetical protein